MAHGRVPDLLRSLLLGAVSLSLAGCGADDQTEEGLSDRPSCEGCAIELVPGVLLSSEAPAGSPLFPSAVARLSDGSYVVGPTYERGTVARFDPDGRLEGVVGQFGEGPGEMEEVHEPLPWTSDSLAILHDNNSVSIFDRSGGYARRMTLEPRSFLTSDISELQEGAFLARRTGTAGGADAALREYSVAGEPVRAFGPEAALGAGRVYAGFATMGDTVWAVDRSRYEIDLFSRSGGDPTGMITREVEWFPPDPPRNEWGGKPSVLDISLYGPGEMLVLLRRPRSDYEFTRPPPSNGPSTGAPRQLDHTDMLERYEQVIELLDLEDGRLIAQLRVENEWVGGFFGSNEVFMYHYDEEAGQVGVSVREVRVVGR